MVVDTHIYRVKRDGLENIPDEGPAILVCNHVSFVDALIIAGSVRRPVCFVMYYRIFNMPILRFVFKKEKAIPITGAREDNVSAPLPTDTSLTDMKTAVDDIKRMN